MFSTNRFLFLFLFSFLLVFSNGTSHSKDDLSKKYQAEGFSLGAIIDYTSRAGKEEKVAIQMAAQDFCAHFSPRPTLHFKNSRGDPIQAASSAKTLVKKYNARAIVGVRTWQEAAFIVDLANKSEVPILSLANEVPSWASRQWPFLVSAARSQFAQMKAVAAIIRTWQWRKVNVIYEDINVAVTGIIPYLADALREVDSEINDLVPISPLPQSYLSERLENLKNEQCRVFIVHTSINLAITIFREAKNLGMMEKEFVWITTSSITDVIDTLNASIISTMQGVLGVKSYISQSRKQNMKDFRSRFQLTFHRQFPNETHSEPGICALQAYDAVRAVALAMERNSDWKHFPNSPDDVTRTDSISAQNLLSRILKINFEGLTGTYNFTQGILSPARIYRIVNVFGKSYTELGYWSDGLGFSESISEGSTYNESMKILGQVLWPGGPWSVPRGWAIAANAKPLRIGVPAGNVHREFVNVNFNNPGSEPNVTGFSINVFKAMVDLLPYNLQYEFVPYQGTYDSLAYQVHLENFDAVVGDTAIVANRSKYAEFSQPYADPGLQMLVNVKPRRTERAWLFKKPFTTLMWAATGAIVLYNGFVVWLIERKHNPEFTRGTKLNQAGTMVSLAFTTLFSLQGEKLHSNLSRMTMVVWLFVALVITQSYTASLTSLLTVQRLDPTTVDIETLKKTGAKVGCDGTSFVVKYLEEVLGFHPNNIKKIYLEDDYPEALTSGDIAAAFLEIPYVKVFLAKNCKGFITGPIFKVGGFGFVFPRSSPYLPDISQAVLQVSESGKLRELENSMMSSYKCAVAGDEDDLDDSLGLTSFGGLFLITVGTSTIALIIFLIRYVYQKHWCCWNNYDVPPQLPINNIIRVDEDWLMRNQPHPDNEHPSSDNLQHQRHAHEHWFSAWEWENQGRSQ